MKLGGLSTDSLSQKRMSASAHYIARLQSLEPIPTAHVLEGLGFKRNRLSCYARNWERLEVVAPEWFGGYAFLCTWGSPNRRTFGIPEFRVPSKIAPACLLAILYKECSGAFEQGALPIEFQIGKAQYEIQRKIQPIIPAPPTMGRSKISPLLSLLFGQNLRLDERGLPSSLMCDTRPAMDGRKITDRVLSSSR
jgi:hypothetical protein